MKSFGFCSRCGQAALEFLRTHSYCWECGYSPESDPGLAAWRDLEFRNRRSKQRGGQRTSGLEWSAFRSPV